MPTEILQMCALPALLESGLRERFLVHRWPDSGDTASWLAAHGAAIRAVVTGGHAGVATSVLQRLPALGIITISGVGYDKVDVNYARERGLRVTITPDVLTDDVADLALGLIIGLLREIPTSDRYVKEGLWAGGNRPLGRKVSGRRFGIIGLGRIGRAIAARLAPIGPVAYSETAEKSKQFPYFANPIDLARASDVLILATSSNASNKNLVGREMLNALGPQGYLVNIARGWLVDEAELIAALVEKRIAGAALDVFADEPNVPEALRAAPNVLLTPHIGSATHETRESMARLALANLDAYFSGQPLPSAVV